MPPPRFGRAINRHSRPGVTPMPAAGLVEDRVSAQGMIAPAANFVDDNGMLSPASFRFLHSMFLAIARLEDRLDLAGVPLAADPDKIR